MWGRGEFKQIRSIEKCPQNWLQPAIHPILYSVSVYFLKHWDEKKSEFNILQQVFPSSCKSPEEHYSLYVFFFSLQFFLRIFLTPEDTLSFRFACAVIMGLTSSLERRGVMRLRSDASGTLQVGWQGSFPRLESFDLLLRMNVCCARKFLQSWLRALGLLPALWIKSPFSPNKGQIILVLYLKPHVMCLHVS